MKRNSIFGIFLLLATFMSAQSDQKAKSILDKLSVKTKAFKTIKADFNYILENKAEDFQANQSGAIATKGHKYYLKIAGQEIRSDGQTVWTYLKDANEVQISEVDNSNEDMITPTTIFTMYEKGFKYEYIKQTTLDGSNVELIHIYPTVPGSKAYHTVKLYIDQDKMELVQAEIMGKEGDTYTYKIKSFQGNAELSDDLFTFNKNNYPGVIVNDLR